MGMFLGAYVRMCMRAHLSECAVYTCAVFIHPRIQTRVHTRVCVCACACACACVRSGIFVGAAFFQLIRPLVLFF